MALRRPNLAPGRGLCPPPRGGGPHAAFPPLHCPPRGWRRSALRTAAGAAGVGGDGGVDADPFPIHVDQPTAARAWIDGGIGLQEVLDPNRTAQADLAAFPGTDDAVRHALIQTKRTADG